MIPAASAGRHLPADYRPGKDHTAMPVTTTNSVPLTGPQIGEAVHIVCKLLDKAELKQLVLTKLNFDLFGEAASEKDPFQTIAYDLLAYVNRHGLVGDFLDALSASRPRDEGLRQFASRVQGAPGAACAGEQVGAFGTAIEAVTANAKADPKFLQVVGMSKARFEVVREELDRLARYKGLHDCLHTLQLQLSAITRASRAFPAEPAAGRELIAYIDQLLRQARRARKNTTGLLTEGDELAWVDDFDKALGAAREAVQRVAGAPLAAAVEALGRLLPEAVRINGEMIGAARRLSPALDELAKTLDDLPEHPAAGDRLAYGGVVGRLEAGAKALDGLSTQLAGLANTHDIWQKIETALTAAEAVPNGPPAQRVPRWPLVKTMLHRVCPAGSIGDPAADPVALADQWEQAVDPTMAENLFLALRAGARHEFKDVDDNLLDLADQLTGTVGPLNTLLGVI
jgi:hypothetical protein